MPAYDNNTPLATQAINQTQAPIRTNFDSLKQLIDINHVDFSDPVDFGKHFFIQLPDGYPKLATSALETGLYCKDGAASNELELFFQREFLGPDLGTPMTESKMNNAGATNGFTWLPSRVKIIWGTATITGGAPDNGIHTIVYLTEVPFFPGFAVNWGPPQLTRISSTATTTNNTVILQSYSQTGFIAKSSNIPVVGGGNLQFAWWAIGL